LNNSDPIRTIEYSAVVGANPALVVEQVIPTRRPRIDRLDHIGCDAVDDAMLAVGQQIYLVAKIALDRPMPIGVFRIERCQHRHIAGAAEICGLITRYLYDRVVGVADLGDWDADIPGEGDPPAEPRQNVGDQRRRRALPFRPGDRDGCDGRLFCEPEVQQRRDLHTTGKGGLDVLTIEADPG
jgi:hypothetical protein